MADRDPLDIEQRLLVNKRLTLNLFIQGAATQAFTSAHHLVDEELNQLNPNLVPQYDRMMASGTLGYWRGGIPLISGRAEKFWKKLDRPGNLFKYHRFMRKHGNEMAMRARDETFERCRKYGVTISGIKNEVAAVKLITATCDMETPIRRQLESLAKQVCSEIYGIETDRLNAEITQSPRWGSVRQPKTLSGRLLYMAMVGWGGVAWQNNRLEVIAKAWIWPLVLHELVKGTVEMICLHGLNKLGTEDFESVMEHTEHIEYEIPMIQVGGEFFRHFLAVVPREIELATCIMHVARMTPVALDDFLFRMVENPDQATQQLRNADAAEA